MIIQERSISERINMTNVKCDVLDCWHNDLGGCSLDEITISDKPVQTCQQYYSEDEYYD